MNDIIVITAEEVVNLYKGIGKSEKQIDSLTFEASETPLSGTIKRLITEPAEYQGNKYFTYEVVDDNGKVIGTMSINRLFDSLVEKDNVIVVANGENKGKGMLKSIRLSQTNHLGKSRAEQIANFVGRKYTAERVTGRVIDKYTPDHLFVPANATDNTVSATNKNKLWANTVVSERLMKVVID